MKKIVSLSLIIGTLVLASASDADVEALAVAKCGECHLMGEITKEKLSNMKAPPYWAIAKKAREKYEKEEDKIKYIVDYAFSPTEDKMLFPKETKEKFGVMPSLKGKVTQEEIRQISTYILEKKF
ncbi:c-type cytochrome [Sulfurimonas sp.]|uniref:c-type cytochrome n=1 Tax=Sulfurimonas sp. TaxID=2022749 RepID=UPI003D0CB3E7